MNGYVGLGSGSLEARFARLCTRVGSTQALAWTTAELWSARAHHVRVEFRQVGVAFECGLSDDDQLIATGVGLVDGGERDPRDLTDSVGVALQPSHVMFGAKRGARTGVDPGAAAVARAVRAAAADWTDFVEPLARLLAAAERDEQARAARLKVRYGVVSRAAEASATTWRLECGVSNAALEAFERGEWLRVRDDHGPFISARILDIERSALCVEIPSGERPPSSGSVRPEVRQKILDQKRALLAELEKPTGDLPHLVRLVAAPESLPAPTPFRPEGFVNSALARNGSQTQAVALALGLREGQALLITGPPGTGKSTTAAEIDVQLIRHDRGVRILVCSHSNHGADNMLMKVVPYLPDAAERIARVGFAARIAPETRPFYASEPADLRARNIVFTTIDALALHDAAGAHLYDYVILDEANRAGVLDSLLALARGKRWILVGDAQQLQPVRSSGERRIRAATAAGVHQSFFSWILERGLPAHSSVFLDEQNRMHPRIGELVSSVFYAGRVHNGPDAPLDSVTTDLIPNSVTWLDTHWLPQSAEQRRPGQTSLRNEAEARVVAALVQHLVGATPSHLSIGVITAYAEQRQRLRSLIRPGGRHIDIHTVDAFEGREKDIIVLSLVRSNAAGQVGFVRDESRLNVAVSRARRLLVIVGDTGTLRGGIFDRLLGAVDRLGAVMPLERAKTLVS